MPRELPLLQALAGIAVLLSASSVNLEAQKPVPPSAISGMIQHPVPSGPLARNVTQKSGCRIRPVSRKANLAPEIDRLPGMPHSAIWPSSTQQGTKSRTYGAFWKVGDGYTTSLILRNKDTEHPVIADITLFSHEGKEEQTSQLQVPPDAVSRIVLNDIIGKAGNTSHWGSLMLEFLQGSASRTVGNVVIENEDKGIIFDLPLLGGYRYDTENALFAPWWLSDKGTDGILTLFNQSEQSIVVSPSLVVSGVEQAVETFTLASHETKQLKLREFLQQHGSEADNGSVVLRYTGPPHALNPALLLSNQATGFSLASAFNAKHHEPAKAQAAWQVPGVFLSPDAELGFNKDNKLTVFALLSNGTESRLSPTITALITDPEGNQVRKVALPVSPLTPLETRLINLSKFVVDGIIPANVSYLTLDISHNGDPGDLGFLVFSVGQDKNFVWRSEGAVHFAQIMDSSYWDIAGNLTALLVVQNAGEVPLKAQARLSYETAKGVQWYQLSPISVPGNGSRILNLKHIILARTPDPAGNIVPANVTFGTLALEVLDKSTHALLVGGTITFDPVNGKYGFGFPPNCDACSFCEVCIEPTDTGGYCQPDCSDPSCCGPPLPAPSLNSITPAQVPIGQSSVRVTLKGSFNSNPSVLVGGNISVSSTTVNSDGSISATFTIPSSDTVGGYGVAVEDDGGISNEVVFAIAPRIDSISPAQGLVGTATNVTFSGQGFGASPSISAPNITVSNVSASDTRITATFTPANSTTAGGNQSVTVTANQVQSDGKNFFVQVPTKLVRLDFPGAPGGIGPLISVPPGNVVDLNGNTVRTNVCGVYRNYAFDIEDANGTSINGNYTWTEMFSNYSTTVPGLTSPTTKAFNFSGDGNVSDIQLFSTNLPNCPGANDHESFDMSFSIAIGSTVYPISTIQHIERGNYSGTAKVAATITIP